MYLAEGLRLAEEAIKSGLTETLFVHETFGDKPREHNLLESAEGMGITIIRVQRGVWASITQTQSPQGVLAVVRKRSYLLEELELIRHKPTEALNSLNSFAPLLVLDGLNDPGNLGTIIRTAWGAGVQGILCLKNTADPYDGKCVRASMGGVFHVPIVTDLSWGQVMAFSLTDGYEAVCADSTADIDYDRFDWPEKTMLCIGSEADGFKEIPWDKIALRVTIPLAHGAESLNASVACGILLYQMKSAGANK